MNIIIRESKHDIGQKKISMKLQLVDHGETETLPEHFKAVVTKCELSRTFNGDALLDIEITELPALVSEPPSDAPLPPQVVPLASEIVPTLDALLAETPTEEKADPDIAAT